MLKKIVSIVTLAFFAMFAFSEESKTARTVRVGCMNHHNFIELKEDGKFYGYAVEYLEELCKYTDWNVEYVLAPWDSQLQMLDEGSLDLVPFAQYSDARAKKYAFSRQPMDTVQGLLCVAEENSDIFYNEFSAFDGKTVGILRGDQNIDYLYQFANLHDFSFNVKEYDFHKDSVDALLKGEVDMVATEQVIGRNGIRIVAHFGSDPSYFMLNKNNKELINELNTAMNEIYAKDGTYRSKLYQKYYGGSIMHATPIFTREEIEFINNRGTVELMLLPDSQPGSYLDENGNFVGIVVDIMNLVSELSGLHFTYHYGENGVPPLMHLQEHPNDVLAGVLSINRAFREANVLMSNDFYTVYASLLANSKNTELIDYSTKPYNLGIPPMFQAMILYIQDNFPNLTVDTSHTTILENLEALDQGEIDLFCYDLNMILHYWGNPRFKDVRIVTSSFVEEPQCCVALNTPENKLLIGIINKCIASIPKEKVAEFERFHISQNYYRPTFFDLIYRLRLPIILGALLVLLICNFFAISIMRKRQHAKIIERKNEELAKAVQKAEHASKAKSDFLSLMSHDIRTPMNAIMGMTKLAQNEHIENQKVNEYLCKIEKSADILLRLLNDVLDKSSIENGKLKITNEPFNLKKELLEIIEIYKPQCIEKNIALISEFSELKTFNLIGDPMRVNQILLNLISNAFKFTEAGGKIAVKVTEEECSDSKVNVKFFVSDTGCGMDEDMLGRIFLAFEQKDATTAHKHGGSGLGLNITKNLTELMHGKIEVTSTVDVGTTFIVTIPFEIDNETSQMEQDKADSEKQKSDWTKQFDFAGKRILVADDDSFNREVVSGLLEMVHAETVCVEDGQAAVNIFENSAIGRFDAILLDIHMPILDGYKATEKIRSSKHLEAPTIPIFALTADASPEDIEKAKEANMNGHITKPVYQGSLYKTLDSAWHEIIHRGGV